MAEAQDLRIWRYMDFAKFASLLTSRSLYFSCPTSQFDDPYEGYVPRSHAKAESEVVQTLVDDMLALGPHFAAQSVVSVEKFDDLMQTFRKNVRDTRRRAASKFGLSCWHIGEDDSPAMWKLYSPSGQGIAIESTIEKLRASLGDAEGVQIGAVIYMDFDRDPIQKGHRHYGLFIKRKCFEHEKELRATVLLPQEGIKGIPVRCDLDVLITRVYVSPFVDGYMRDAVEALCLGTAHVLRKPVLQSQLFTEPDYGTEIDLRPERGISANG
jgi:hypothetical protein